MVSWSKITITVSIVFFIFFNSMAISKAASHWARAYGGSESDFFESLQQTMDGGFVFAGITRSFGAGYNDAWVVKLDGKGRVSWAKRYGGTDSSDSDIARSIRQTEEGGYIVVGETRSFGAGSIDAWVLKLDGSGNIVWENTYGGNRGDQADCVRETVDGGFIVAGSTQSFGTSKEIWVFNLNSNGAIQWQKTYGGLSGEEDALVELTNDGGYIVSSRTWSLGAGYVDIWFLRLDGNGNVLWDRTFGGDRWDEVNSIRQTLDNGFIIAGATDSFGPGPGERNAWLIKLDQKGIISWQKTYGGHKSYESSYLSSLDLTTDGNFIVAGYTEAFGADWSDIWILKISPNGNILWEKRFGLVDDGDRSQFVQQTRDGGFMLASRDNIFADDIFGDNLDIYLYNIDKKGDLPVCIPGFETHTTDAVVSIPQLPWIIIYPYNVQDTSATVLKSSAVVTDTGCYTRLMCPFGGHIPPIMMLLNECQKN